MSFGDQPPFSTENTVPPKQLQTSAIEKEVQRCDDELFRLYTLVSQRETERRELQLNADKCISILAPIRRLPNEMLSEIFAQCCKEADESVNFMNAPRTLNALIISLVCSHWRRLAISTKSLWAVFSINPTTPSTFTLQCLRAYMSRAGDAPLTIQVLNTYRDTPARAGAFQCYRVLFDAAPRWRILGIGSIHFGQRLSHVKHHLQDLEGLSLNANCLLAAPTDIFADAPKLRILSVNVTPELISHTFPYNQITNLSMYNQCQHRFFINFLSKFPQVRNLEFEGNIDDFSKLETPKTDLVVQTLYIGNVEIIPLLIRAFTFLQLKSITLTCNDTAELPRFVRVHKQFLELLEQPLQGLNVLVLEEIEIGDQEMIAILRLTPSLTELSIQTTDVDLAENMENCKTLRKDFVRSLIFCPPIIQSQRPSVPNLLPKLTSLDLGLNPSPNMHEALVDMLTSRWHPRALASVHGRVSCLDCVILRHIVKPEHTTIVSQLQDRAGKEHHFRWLDSSTLSLTRKRK
ncbi:uncharacterized protein BT62DRAFT_638698 [Guyanagaster necrorhizus]|uniref:F-box domain-containing protein n=1 Tax=Guyanagaster necrorhizus TaxID=856835 RepID=A0A9P8ALT2_9AGAR|nr:uncharacterized protein BT62DRAFT_638698 [Guyanagaster necrorhizus MCA 3950]KAG7440120.1 hypothetical protein BT62DRAFT_638698 [Guyanagaster necrorhizus MCA 3950]